MRTIAAAILTLVAAPALAEPIPKVDVVAACRLYANTATSPSKVQGRNDLCIERAQSTYDKLKTVWGNVSDSEQRACVAKVDAKSDWFYGWLLTCVEEQISERGRRERERNQPPPQREFRY